MDEIQQQVIDQLPEDGSPISFDEWKERVATNVGPLEVQRTANKYNRGYVNYFIVKNSSTGEMDLMVSKNQNG